MPEPATVENAAMERQEYMDTKPQDRYAGQLKFDFCHWCGRPDGMKSVHRETLEEMAVAVMAPLAWYQEQNNEEYLFYPCPECNRYWTIPDDFTLMLLGDVLEWRSADPMAPDYAALVRKEPVSQITDSRKSARL